MTCPTCNDAGFIETRTSGGLVERKACAHVVATGPQPQQSGDMATNGVHPVVTAGPSQTSQGEAAKALPDASKNSHSNHPEAQKLFDHLARLEVREPRPASWPFDPEPRALEPAQNGYIWCDGCESVQPVTGHECGTASERAYRIQCVEYDRDEAEERAERAESLLCAMAFDHGAWLGAREFRLMHCSYYVLGCVFCDATRGGGR